MCFHYALTAKAKKSSSRYRQIKEDFSFLHANGFENPKMPVILDSNQQELSFLDWGLIPSWIKSAKEANTMKIKTLNARIETISTKASFKESIEHTRCLVLASGFYEYHHFEGKMYPYFISLKNEELFSFAGIWSTWLNNDTSKRINSFSIVTTIANEIVAKVHNNPKKSKEPRMPIILTKEKEALWLNRTSDCLNSFQKPLSSIFMKAKLIKKIGGLNNQPELFA